MMCGDHRLEPLPPEVLAMLDEVAIPIRCLPPLGVHEHCEHDPDHRPPSFRKLVSV